MATAITSHDSNANNLLPFTVGDRTLVTKGSKPGKLTTLHLEDVRDYLAKLTAVQDPVDIERSLDQMHVSFADGHMTGQLMGPQGLADEKYVFSTNGASQMAKEVLPNGFFKGLKQQAQFNQQGAKLATINWSFFANQYETPRLVRTVRTKCADGEVRRMIRSCHSQGYGVYGNLQFVQDILDNAGEFRELPVVDFRVTDSVMRLRFVEGDIELNKPVQMYEAWNSEVGRRRVGLRGGSWKLVCTNGMGHWNDKTEYNWIHRGDAERIQRGVKDAFLNLRTTASGVLDAYQEAMNVSIDNAFQWLEEQMQRRGASSVRIEAAKQGMTDETSTPGLNLASAIDGITLIAQNDADLLEQYELERMAADLLHRSLNKARSNGGRLYAEA
jgi:hypothetical protein